MIHSINPAMQSKANFKGIYFDIKVDGKGNYDRVAFDTDNIQYIKPAANPAGKPNYTDVFLAEGEEPIHVPRPVEKVVKDIKDFTGDTIKVIDYEA